MSFQAKGFFTILGHVGGSGFRILENVPESVEELIEIAQSDTAKTEDGKPVIVLKTTQGRQFVRVGEWPENLLFETQES